MLAAHRDHSISLLLTLDLLAWWCTLLIPALGRWTQEDPTSGLHGATSSYENSYLRSPRLGGLMYHGGRKDSRRPRHSPRIYTSSVMEEIFFSGEAIGKMLSLL